MSDVVTLPLCNTTNLRAQAPNMASLAFAASAPKPSFCGEGKKCRLLKWYAVRMLGLVQLCEFPALLLPPVQSLTCHANSVCFVKLCNKATVSMPPVVCLFRLFSCRLLSSFFLFKQFNSLCSFWLCTSLPLITHLLSSSACQYVHTITTGVVAQGNSKYFKKIYS